MWNDAWNGEIDTSFQVSLLSFFLLISFVEILLHEPRERDGLAKECVARVLFNSLDVAKLPTNRIECYAIPNRK